MRSQDTITVPAVDELDRFTQTFYAAHGFMPIAGGETAPAPAPAPVGDGGAPASEGEPQGAPDLNAVVDRLEQVIQRVPEPTVPEVQPPAPSDAQAETDRLLDELFGPDPAAAAQQIPAPAPDAAQQPGQGQALDPADAERVLQDIVGSQTDARLREVMAPVLGKLTALEQREKQAELSAIAADFPEWKDPATAPKLQAEVQFWAQEAGQPDLAREPWFIELATQAYRGAESGSREITPGQQPPTAGALQPAGAARPGQGGEQPSPFEAIKKAAPPGGGVFR